MGIRDEIADWFLMTKGEGESHARGEGPAPDEGEENSGKLKRGIWDTRKTEKRETDALICISF